MEIITRDQIEKNMVLLCVRVDSARETYIEKLVAASLPYKKGYGDNEFFMWQFDAKDEKGNVRPVSVTDMGIEQIPQYNLHATFTTRTEAINYEHTVGIDYDNDEKKDNYVEIGENIYSLDDSVDSKELIPFDFEAEDMSPELQELCVSWTAALSDANENNLQDADEYANNNEETAYDRAMKMID